MPPRRPCNRRLARLLRSSGKEETGHSHVHLHLKAACLQCAICVLRVMSSWLSGCLLSLLCPQQKPLTDCNTFSTA